MLGAHVDYNEGWVLPGAVDRSIWLAAGLRTDGRSLIFAADLEDEAAIDMMAVAGSPDPALIQEGFAGWTHIPLGVAWVMSTEEKSLPGLNVVFTGDIPIGAGVSSSAAVEIAFITAWEQLAGLSFTGRRKALLGQLVENDFLGFSSGIMDQYASIHGKAGCLLFLDCRTIDSD